jgi:coproporphyrinogen III oxidase-like Fe-S oxidoreductase
MNVYELGLNAPRMEEEFKLTIALSRRHLLLFCLLVENAMKPGKQKTEELSAVMTKEMAAEISALIPEILKKGGQGLYEFYERLTTV